MADRVNAADAAWFAARTDGAPDALRVRSERFFAAAADGDMGDDWRPRPSARSRSR